MQYNKRGRGLMALTTRALVRHIPCLLALMTVGAQAATVDSVRNFYQDGARGIKSISVIDYANDGGDADALIGSFTAEGACLRYAYDDSKSFAYNVRVALFDVDGNIKDIPIYRVTPHSPTSPTDTDCNVLVPPNTPPTAVDDEFAVDGATALNVLANDLDPDPGDKAALTVEKTSDPSNGTVVPSPGGFTYTPNPGTSGPDEFTYRAYDGKDYSPADATVKLNVPPPANTPPVARNDTYVVDGVTSLSPLDNDSDADGDALEVVIVSTPQQGELIPVPSSNGLFTYRPGPDASGQDQFTYRAFDGVDESRNLATVTLEFVNGAPVAVDDSVDVDGVTQFAPLANDSDPDGDTLSIASNSDPAKGQLQLNSDGSFAYTPDNGATGTDSFTYTATDGALNSDLATVTLALPDLPNRPPQAVDDQFSVTGATNLNLLANDSDPDGDALAILSNSNPTKGQLQPNEDGSLTYTPNSGATGTDSFTYTATDGLLDSGLATVTLALPDPPQNRAPQAVDDRIPVDGVTRLTPLANDSDPDGDSLSIALNSNPSQGQLQPNEDGSLTYTPAAGAAGTDSFTYRANDGELDSGLATVTLIFPDQPPNSPPVALADNYTVNGATRLDVLANDSDPDPADAGNLLVEKNQEPTQGRLDIVDGGRAFVYTPNENASGSDRFTYSAVDLQGARSAPAEVQLSISDSPMNPVPVAVADNFGTQFSGADVVANDDLMGLDRASIEVLEVGSSTPSNAGDLVLSPEGIVGFTPSGRYAGEVRFSYRLRTLDGEESQAVRVVFNVTASSLGFEASPDVFGSNYEGRSVRENDSVGSVDPDDVAAQLVGGVMPSQAGTLVLAPDGTFTFAANMGYAGPVSFNYVLRTGDGAVISESALASFSVFGDLQATPDMLGTDFENQNLTSNDNLGGLDPTTVTAVIVSPPEPSDAGNLILEPDGRLIFEPNGRYDGEVEVVFSYQLVADSGAQSEAAEVTFTLNDDTEGDLEDKEDETGKLSEQINANETDVMLRIDELCPLLEDEGSLTADQQDLLTQCTTLRQQGTTVAEAAHALDVITPEEVSSQRKIGRETTLSQFRNIAARIEGVRRGSKGVSVAGLNIRYGEAAVAGDAVETLLDESMNALLGIRSGGGASADEPSAEEMYDFGNLGLFVRGDLNFGEQDETELESGFDYDTQAITFGVDYRFNDNFFAGVSASVGTAEVDFEQNRGDVETDSYALALYGSYYTEGSAYFDAILSYGWSDIETTRNLVYEAYGERIDRKAKSDTEGDNYYFSVNGGYNFSWGGWSLDPSLRFYYMDGSIDSYRESGARGWDLAFDAQDYESMTLSAGGQLRYVFRQDWGVLIPYLRVEFTREFEDNARGVVFRFVNDPFFETGGAGQIQVLPESPDSNYMVYGAGVSAQLTHGFSGFVSYSVLGSYDDLDNETVSFGLRWETTF